MRLLLPKAKHSVKAWRTLRGKATDTAGTGVKFVQLRAVEKRGTSWYAYKTTTKTWVRATTKAKAFAKSGTLTMHTSATHLWAGKLVGLRKGTLVYRVKATDNGRQRLRRGHPQGDAHQALSCARHRENGGPRTARRSRRRGRSSVHQSRVGRDLRHA